MRERFMDERNREGILKFFKKFIAQFFIQTLRMDFSQKDSRILGHLFFKLSFTSK